ncbi:MAG TPA: hypothetical protein VJ770_23010 [Stellaceae bacterium]|nr:hypothetical protein [Stellaceae bacterium]
MRKTDEQKKAALQQRIAALKMKVRRIEKREADAERRARNHRLIVIGAIVEQRALDNPRSISMHSLVRDIEAHVTAHPEDHDTFAGLLTRLNTPADRREAAE